MKELPVQPRHGALDPGDPTDMAESLAEHPFTAAFGVDLLGALVGMTAHVEVGAGGFVLRHGQPAEALYLVTQGDVALEVHTPTRAPIILETLHPGDVLGWSWLYEPHRWQFDARAQSDVTALAIDAAGLRKLMDDDPAIGYAIARRIGRVMADRVTHARAQLASVSLL